MRWCRIDVVFAAVAALALVGRASLAKEMIPGWHSNLDEARRQAESTGKPLFITFRCVR